MCLCFGPMRHPAQVEVFMMDDKLHRQNRGFTVPCCVYCVSDDKGNQVLALLNKSLLQDTLKKREKIQIQFYISYFIIKYLLMIIKYLIMIQFTFNFLVSYLIYIFNIFITYYLLESCKLYEKLYSFSGLLPATKGQPPWSYVLSAPV